MSHCQSQAIADHSSHITPFVLDTEGRGKVQYFLFDSSLGLSVLSPWPVSIFNYQHWCLWIGKAQRHFTDDHYGQMMDKNKAAELLNDIMAFGIFTTYFNSPKNGITSRLNMSEDLPLPLPKLCWAAVFNDQPAGGLVIVLQLSCVQIHRPLF